MGIFMSISWMGCSPSTFLKLCEVFIPAYFVNNILCGPTKLYFLWSTIRKLANQTYVVLCAKSNYSCSEIALRDVLSKKVVESYLQVNDTHTHMVTHAHSIWLNTELAICSSCLTASPSSLRCPSCPPTSARTCRGCTAWPAARVRFWGFQRPSNQWCPPWGRSFGCPVRWG